MFESTAVTRPPSEISWRRVSGAYQTPKRKDCLFVEFTLSLLQYSQVMLTVRFQLL